jgi:DNA repair exonuclease SbcCD ATPase subunit
MEPITITEALAEIKTISKRLAKKQEFIRGYIARNEGIKDPLEKQGGSAKMIAEERQSITDLEDRVVALRRGIQRANENTTVTINGVSRSIADWLTWRRDVAPGRRTFLTSLQQTLNSVREQAKKQGSALVQATAVTAETQPNDIIVNIDELEVSRAAEQLEDTLGTLDGQLSLKNATVVITA